MDCKTGAEHLASLRDGRTVYIDGARVADVTTHPAFRNAIRSAAALYDFQARPENIERLTFEPSGGHRRINRCWQKPRNHQELVRRRQALVAWAEQSAGFVGRSPDHVASSLLGQVMGIEVFRRRCSITSIMSAPTICSSAMSSSTRKLIARRPGASRTRSW